MKLNPLPEHPNVTYWRCPVGCIHIEVTGSAIPALITAMGATLDTDDLADALPLSMLHVLESAVEEHERSHLSSSGCSTTGGTE